MYPSVRCYTNICLRPFKAVPTTSASVGLKAENIAVAPMFSRSKSHASLRSWQGAHSYTRCFLDIALLSYVDTACQEQSIIMYMDTCPSAALQARSLGYRSFGVSV